ncbi:hypothetical protein EVA_11826 [gut metagenome]|uniref:Uncharacterized protein n=1 Tax=gut metagenome TaxID=749906 RepID=J9FZT3_9ZZZZ
MRLFQVLVQLSLSIHTRSKSTSLPNLLTDTMLWISVYFSMPNL